MIPEYDDSFHAVRNATRSENETKERLRRMVVYMLLYVFMVRYDVR